MPASQRIMTTEFEISLEQQRALGIEPLVAEYQSNVLQANNAFWQIPLHNLDADWNCDMARAIILRLEFNNDRTWVNELISRVEACISANIRFFDPTEFPESQSGCLLARWRPTDRGNANTKDAAMHLMSYLTGIKTTSSSPSEADIQNIKRLLEDFLRPLSDFWEKVCGARTLFGSMKSDCFVYEQGPVVCIIFDIIFDVYVELTRTRSFVSKTIAASKYHEPDGVFVSEGDLFSYCLHERMHAMLDEGTVAEDEVVQSVKSTLCHLWAAQRTHQRICRKIEAIVLGAEHLLVSVGVFLIKSTFDLVGDEFQQMFSLPRKQCRLKKFMLEQGNRVSSYMTVLTYSMAHRDVLDSLLKHALDQLNSMTCEFIPAVRAIKMLDEQIVAPLSSPLPAARADCLAGRALCLSALFPALEGLANNASALSLLRRAYVQLVIEELSRLFAVPEASSVSAQSDMHRSLWCA